MVALTSCTQYRRQTALCLSRNSAACVQYSNIEVLPGGSHVACLNIKTSCVGVYKCFTLRSEIGQKFFVFVAILEKRDRNHYSSSISQLTFRILNTILVLWFHFMLCCYFLGHVACQNLPWQGLDIHVNLFLNTWPQLYKRWKGYQLDKSLSLSSG